MATYYAADVNILLLKLCHLPHRNLRGGIVLCGQISDGIQIYCLTEVKLMVHTSCIIFSEIMSAEPVQLGSP
jgi:hypothetical protein